MDDMADGPCWAQLQRMGATDATIEGEGVVHGTAEVLWRLGATIPVFGEARYFVGRGFTKEEAACEMLRQVRGLGS